MKRELSQQAIVNDDKPAMNRPTSNSTTDTPLPLPRRAKPYPDEDLLSIIRRSASHMGYEDLRWLLRPEGDRWDIKEKEVPLLSK
jgi:hypothetical protein